MIRRFLMIGSICAALGVGALWWVGLETTVHKGFALGSTRYVCVVLYDGFVVVEWVEVGGKRPMGCPLGTGFLWYETPAGTGFRFQTFSRSSVGFAQWRWGGPNRPWFEFERPPVAFVGATKNRVVVALWLPLAGLMAYPAVAGVVGLRRRARRREQVCCLGCGYYLGEEGPGTCPCCGQAIGSGAAIEARRALRSRAGFWFGVMPVIVGMYFHAIEGHSELGRHYLAHALSHSRDSIGFLFVGVGGMTFLLCMGFGLSLWVTPIIGAATARRYCVLSSVAGFLAATVGVLAVGKVVNEITRQTPRTGLLLLPVIFIGLPLVSGAIAFLFVRLGLCCGLIRRIQG